MRQIRCRWWGVPIRWTSMRIMLMRIPPIPHPLRSSQFSLLLQIFELRVRLSSSSLSALSPLPFSDRVVSLQDRRQSFPPSDDILIHMLQPRQRRRDVIHHMIDRVRPCPCSSCPLVRVRRSGRCQMCRRRDGEVVSLIRRGTTSAPARTAP